MAVLRRSPLAWAVLGSAAVACLRSISRGQDATFVAAQAASSLELKGASAACGTLAGGLGCSAGSSLRTQGAATTRAAVPLGIAPEVPSAAALGMELGETVLGLAALYTIMSINEYIYHRYFQHLGINKLDTSRAIRKEYNFDTYRGDGHVEHHRETLDDMTLDERPHPMLDADPFRGTAFPWWATCVMTFSVMVPSLPILGALGWSQPVIVVTVIAALLVHAMVWNTLHPNMHGLPDVPITHGVPSVLTDYRDSALFAWLRMNHEGHHRTEGAHGNYNVCCPLVDQLVGTYVGEIPMQEPASEPERVLETVQA